VITGSLFLERNEAAEEISPSVMLAGRAEERVKGMIK
jgi:hypothetical protein